MTICLVIIIAIAAFYLGGILGYLLACLMFTAGRTSKESDG